MTAIPKDWSGFLRVDDNKKELFTFLSKLVLEILGSDDCRYIVGCRYGWLWCFSI